VAYLTVAELVAYAGIDSARDNALLTSLIARAQAIIEREVGYSFEASGDTTRYLDAGPLRDGGAVDGLRLWLPTGCASITSITNGDSVAVATTAYVTEPRTAPYYAVKLKASKALRWELNSDNDPENAITVVGKWAYSTSAGEDVKHATARLALWLYRQRDNSTDLDRPLVADGITILPASIPTDVAAFISAYRWRGGGGR
jgi:hypothetical protein